jgi:hypothetical protein
MPPKKKTTEPVTEETVEETAQEAPPSDETDVQAALDTTTQDGPGDDPVPPSDFQSFATEGVHPEDKQVGELAGEVLQGLWGDFSVSRDRLDNAGHDASAVLAKVNERLMRGSPSAYRATTEQVVDQISRGEWGDNERALEARLLGAGYKASDVVDILRSAHER